MFFFPESFYHWLLSKKKCKAWVFLQVLLSPIWFDTKCKDQKIFLKLEIYAKIKKGWLEPDIFIYSVCVLGGGGGGGQGCAKALSIGAVRKWTHKINKVNPQKRDTLCISMSMLPLSIKKELLARYPWNFKEKRLMKDIRLLWLL